MFVTMYKLGGKHGPKELCKLEVGECLPPIGSILYLQTMTNNKDNQMKVVSICYYFDLDNVVRKIILGVIPTT